MRLEAFMRIYALANIGKHRGMFADDVAARTVLRQSCQYARRYNLHAVDRAQSFRFLSSAPAIACMIPAPYPTVASLYGGGALQ